MKGDAPEEKLAELAQKRSPVFDIVTVPVSVEMTRSRSGSVEWGGGPASPRRVEPAGAVTPPHGGAPRGPTEV